MTTMGKLDSTVADDLIDEVASIILITAQLQIQGYPTNYLDCVIPEMERHALLLRHHVSPNRKFLKKWHRNKAVWHHIRLTCLIDTCQRLLARAA